MAQREAYIAAASFVRERGKDAYVSASAKFAPPAIFADEPNLMRAVPDIKEDLLATVLEGAASSDLPPLTSLAALSMPTLILAWETDPGHPVATAEALAATLPNTELSVASSLDAVRRWGDVAASFLERL